MPNQITNQTINGKKEGLWISFFANGNKRSEGAFENGEKQGKWTLYHKNGNLQSVAVYKNGFYSDYYVSYHENGEKFREGYYNEYAGKSSDGRKEGVWYQYLPDGKTVEWQITYKRGRAIKRIPFPANHGD